MTCKFDPTSCSSECPKFSICMYRSIQTQLSEINSQINFVLNILTQLSCETGIQKEHLNFVENNVNDIVSTLIELTNDSNNQNKITNTGVRINEKSISENIHRYLVKHSGNEEKIAEFSDFIESFFCDMEDDYSEVKAGFYTELEDFTDELDEEMIHAMVEKFKRKDGTVSGVKWTLEEVENVAKQYDVKSRFEGSGKTCDMMKFWVSMNYVYAAHYSVNRTINGYIDLAIDEYLNKNICFDFLLKKIFEKI